MTDRKFPPLPRIYLDREGNQLTERQVRQYLEIRRREAVVADLDHPGNHAEGHAWVRAMERYGKDLSEEDTADMICQIREGRGLHLYKKGERISVWLVHWPSCGLIVPVYYDRKLKKIASVLPRTPIYKPRVMRHPDDVNSGMSEEDSSCQPGGITKGPHEVDDLTSVEPHRDALDHEQDNREDTKPPAKPEAQLDEGHTLDGSTGARWRNPEC